MKTFRVIEVGTLQGVVVEAHNDDHAIAEVAQCAVNDVPLPLWGQPDGRRCYMPFDNSGRQWLIEEVMKEP